MSVSVCVCPRAYLPNYMSEFLSVCYLWPLVVPSATPLRYGLYFRVFFQMTTCFPTAVCASGRAVVFVR